MDDETLIIRLQHLLMLRGKFVPDVGLWNGKMGIVLAFAHLYKYTHNEIFYDCMSGLLDEVVENIYKGLEMGLASGFAGIGWGLEYLLQNGLVEGDGVEVCEEIDKKIMAFDVRRMDDVSLENGLEGLLHYVLIHIRGSKKQLPFDGLYFSDLYERIKTGVDGGQWGDALIRLGRMYMRWFETRILPDYSLDVMRFVTSSVIEPERFGTSPLGLRDGLSGLLLKRLLV